MRIKKPTCTSLVAEYLRGLDDFADLAMIRRATGLDTCRAGAALHHLRTHRVVDVVVEPSGRGWWFALPPESDDRLRTLDERVEETTPRRPRRKKEKPDAAS